VSLPAPGTPTIMILSCISKNEGNALPR
jgi:hypothetical protein